MKYYFLCSYIAAKEHEMEIGLPTDVKHVSHIGWDRSSDHAPSWVCYDINIYTYI